VPQIVAYDIVDGYSEYLKWIGNETKWFMWLISQGYNLTDEQLKSCFL
jgi:hypothetical protein